MQCRELGLAPLCALCRPRRRLASLAAYLVYLIYLLYLIYLIYLIVLALAPSVCIHVVAAAHLSPGLASLATISQPQRIYIYVCVRYICMYIYMKMCRSGTRQQQDVSLFKEEIRQHWWRWNRGRACNSSRYPFLPLPLTPPPSCLYCPSNMSFTRLSMQIVCVHAGQIRACIRIVCVYYKIESERARGGVRGSGVVFFSILAIFMACFCVCEP